MLSGKPGAVHSPDEERASRLTWPSGAELRSLEKLLNDIGLAPHYGGMEFVKIRNKGYLWVSKQEAAAHREAVPQLAYIPD